MEKETPFSSLIPTKRLGEDGLPRIASVSDEDLEDERLARVELPRIGIAGEVVAQVLEQALERIEPQSCPTDACADYGLGGQSSDGRPQRKPSTANPCA